MSACLGPSPWIIWACIISMQDIFTRRRINLYAKQTTSKVCSLFLILHVWIKPDLPRLLERWKHTWGINVVMRKRLLLLYFCPAKLFSSLTLVCQRLWEWRVCMRVCVFACTRESRVSGHTQHCVFNCPSPEQPIRCNPDCCCCVDLSFPSAGLRKAIKKRGEH